MIWDLFLSQALISIQYTSSLNVGGGERIPEIWNTDLKI